MTENRSDAAHHTNDAASHTTKDVHHDSHLTHEAQAAMRQNHEQSKSAEAKSAHEAKPGDTHARIAAHLPSITLVDKDHGVHPPQQTKSDFTPPRPAPQVQRDASGRLVGLDDGMGHHRTIKYDAKGQVAEFFDPVKLGKIQTTDGKHWTNQWSRNFEGNCVVDQKTGTVSFINNITREITEFHTDGTRRIIMPDGSSKSYRSDGKLSGFETATHHKYVFGYSPSGQWEKLTQPNGEVFTKSGANWTSGKTTFKGDVVFDDQLGLRFTAQDKSTTIVCMNGTAETRKPNGEIIDFDAHNRASKVHGAVAPGMMATEAMTIHKSLDSQNGQAIINTLMGKSEADKKALALEYRLQYHAGLADDLANIQDSRNRDQAQSLLHMKDGFGTGNSEAQVEAVRIHSLMAKFSDLTADSDPDVAAENRASGSRDIQNIRDQLVGSLDTMNSQMAKDASRAYQQLYGKSMIADLNNPELSPADAALPILAKGIDRRTDQDSLNLASIALETKNLNLFQKTFERISDTARATFLQHNGDKRINDAFGPSFLDHFNLIADYKGWRRGMSVIGRDAIVAKDIAHTGHESIDHEMRDQIGVFSTDQGKIENLITRLSDHDRKLYTAGMQLHANPNAQIAKGIDARESLAYYDKLQAALNAASVSWNGISGGAAMSKVAAWQEKIVAPNCSFCEKLHAKSGFLTLGLDDLRTQISRMDKVDFDRMKSNPTYRSIVEDCIYNSVAGAYYEQGLDLLKQKLDQPTFQQATDVGKRPVLQALDNCTHLLGNDEAEAIDVLNHMKKDEQAQYQRGVQKLAITGSNHNTNDPDIKFAQRLRAKVDDVFTETDLSGNNHQVADYILNKLAEGQTPNQTLVCAYTQAVRDHHFAGCGHFELARAVDEELSKNPALAKQARAEFATDANQTGIKAMLSTAFNDDSEDQNSYKHFAPAVLRLNPESVATRIEMYKDDKPALAKLMLGAPKEERDLLLNINPATSQTKAVQHALHDNLSNDQIAVLQNLMLDSDKPKDAATRAVDLSRAYVLGVAPNKDDVLSTLSGMTDGQKSTLQKDYHTRYGANSSLLVDIQQLDTEDQNRISSALFDKTAHDHMNTIYQDIDHLNSGFGRDIVQLFGSSSEQVDTCRLAYEKSVADAAAHYRSLGSDAQKQLLDDVTAAIEKLKSDKSAAASAAAAVLIGAAATIAAPFTGGMSFAAAAAISAVSGSLIQVATRALVIGEDYSSTDLKNDIITGFVSGGTMAIGSTQFVQLMGVGKMAAEATVTQTAAACNLSKAATEVMETETNNAVRGAIISGGEQKVSDAAIDKIVRKTLAKETTQAVDEQARIKLETTIKEHLTDNIRHFTKIEAQSVKAKFALSLRGRIVANSTSSAAGGWVSGATSGALNWDPRKGLVENTQTIIDTADRTAAYSGFGGAGLTLVLGAMGKAHPAATRVDNPLLDHFTVSQVPSSGPGILTSFPMKDTAIRPGLPSGALASDPASRAGLPPVELSSSADTHPVYSDSNDVRAKKIHSEKHAAHHKHLAHQ